MTTFLRPKQIDVAITDAKSANQRQRQLAAKRGSGRVRGESVFENAEPDSRGIEQVVATEPSPEMATQLSEECERLLAELGEEELRHVACLKLEGYSNCEIAENLGVVERTVERKLRRIRRQWSEERSQ